jgi:hypothetical protein
VAAEGIDKISALSVAAFLLAAVSPFCGPIAFLPAIVCGHLALARQKREPNLQGYHFASAALVIGYLVATIFIVRVIWLLGWLNQILGVSSPSLFPRQEPLQSSGLVSNQSLGDWLGTHPVFALIAVVVCFIVILQILSRLVTALRQNPKRSETI